MSAAIAAASAAALASRRQKYNSTSNYNSIFPASNFYYPNSSCLVQPSVGRYESQKRCDWNSFTQYLHNHQSRLFLSRCSGEHVVEFLRYLDQFGKTKVHSENCRPFFGQSDHQYSSPPCACPLRQAWGSVDAIVGRLRVAFEENGGSPDLNPFAARPVRLYLRDVRETQAKARGVTYEIKKKKMVMT